jgi:hypothetical protein
MVVVTSADMAASTVPEISFSLQSVYACWKEFDLEGRRTNLDEVGTLGYRHLSQMQPFLLCLTVAHMRGVLGSADHWLLQLDMSSIH